MARTSNHSRRAVVFLCLNENERRSAKRLRCIPLGCVHIVRSPYMCASFIENIQDKRRWLSSSVPSAFGGMSGALRSVDVASGNYAG